MQLLLENGIYDIPNDIYHSSGGVSRSALMELKRSPYHYWYKYLNPEREYEKPTPAMKLGELVHALVLEPQYFEERYVIPPELHQVPKVELLKDLVASLGKEEGRKEYDIQKSERDHIIELNEMVMASFANSAELREVVKPDMYIEAKALADAVMRDPMAQQLLDGAKTEQSIYFTDKETGIQFKSRPDAWMGSVVIDLKTTKDSNNKIFQLDAYRNGYFLQAAMAYKALESIGVKMEKFIFLCVEKTQPYATAIYMLDDESIDFGISQFNALSKKLYECLSTDKWPCYGIQEIGLPAFAMHEDY